jgi:hypothetical protein
MSTVFAFTPVPPSRKSSKPEIMAELTGFWRGRMVRADAEHGGGTSFTLIRDASADASVTGRFLFFSTRHVPPTGVKLLEASRSAFVALVGPYYDPDEDAEVVTVLEGRRVGADLQGTFNTRLVRGWRRGRSGWFVAERTEPGHRDD